MEPASGITLNAMFFGNFCGAGMLTAWPSCTRPIASPLSTAASA